MSGPNDKIEQLYEQNNHKIRRFLLLKTDIQTAEDVTQLTFIKAMEHLHTFRGDSSTFTWLCTIASNALTALQLLLASLIIIRWISSSEIRLYGRPAELRWICSSKRAQNGPVLTKMC